MAFGDSSLPTLRASQRGDIAPGAPTGMGSRIPKARPTGPTPQATMGAMPPGGLPGAAPRAPQLPFGPIPFRAPAGHNMGHIRRGFKPVA